jgi:hypothetical protein
MIEYGRLPQGIERPPGQLKELLIIRELPRISELARYEPPSEMFEDADPFHRGRHAAGVLVWSELITGLPGFRNQTIDREAIRWAATLHDCGRNGLEDDPDHGERGAEKAYQFLRDRLPAASLDTALNLIRGHAPNGKVDPTLPPWHLTILKDADKIELMRYERLDLGKIDRSKFSLQMSERVFLPLCEAVYDKVDHVQEHTGVNGFRAYLLSTVGVGIVDPR